MLDICYCMNCNRWFRRSELVNVHTEYGWVKDACPGCEQADDIYDDFSEDEIVEILNKKDVKIGPYRDW